MAENDFLNGLRIEQFIKSNNDQLKDSLKEYNTTITNGISSILNNQKTQITSIKSIDKSTKSIDSSITKLVSGQDKLIKAFGTMSTKLDTSTTSDIKKILQSTTAKEKKVSEKKDTFRRVDYNKENNELLYSMNKSLGALGNVREKGGGFLKALMMLGSGVLAGGGLIGYILTGKKEALQGMFKGLVKGFGSVFGITKAIPKLFGGIGNIITSAGKLKKLFTRFGLGKGMSLLGKRALGKGFAKGAGKTALKNLPGIGSVLNLVFAVQKFKKGDVVGGLLEFGSFAADFIPGIGPAIGLALDIYGLKRDLTISPGDLQTEKDIFFHPIKSVKTLIQGGKDKKYTKKSEALDPSHRKGVRRLKSLSMDQRQGFKAWQKQTYGRELNTSILDDKSRYESMVEEYRQHLGVGGGGFQFTDSDISQGNGMPYDDSTAKKDDNWEKITNISKYKASVRSNKNYKKYVRLNPNENPDMNGVNSIMRSRFYKMAKEFNKDTGGSLMVNSAKRNGGKSVHNKGYAIDVNALDANGRRFGDGYIPEGYLAKYGFHRPLLNYKSVYGGPKDEPWHIEPFPGDDVYGGGRNTLASGQPYRKGVLLSGKSGYSSTDVGGGGLDNSDFNLPQGNLDKRSNTNTSMNVSLSESDINALAIAFGRQMKQNIKPTENIVMTNNSANPRNTL